MLHKTYEAKEYAKLNERSFFHPSQKVKSDLFPYLEAQTYWDNDKEEIISEVSTWRQSLNDEIIESYRARLHENEPLTSLEQGMNELSVDTSLKDQKQQSSR
ncbi:hypothetical protein RLOatenuis_3560 [Rickettsiales bacterium]|nr:hypothetical protein RLOatenuis_3560 [Rickettsiales bacterium]